MRHAILGLVTLAAAACREAVSVNSSHSPILDVASGPPQYLEVRLTPTGLVAQRPLSFPTAINDANQVVGYWYLTGNESDGRHAFLWQAGNMEDLGTIGTGSSWANDINDAGQVVGRAGGHAFLWQDGVMQDLGLGEARHINQRGQIVGVTTGGSFFWDGGPMQMLPLTAAAINSLGQVAGWVTTNGTRRAALWEAGTLTDLGTLGGDSSWALGMNDEGVVVGASSTVSGEQHAFRWSAGQMEDLGVLPGTSSSVAKRVNNRGQIIGTSTGDALLFTHGFFWQDGVLQDIGSLNPEYHVTAVNGLNADGSVTGMSYEGFGTYSRRPFVWKDGIMRNLGWSPVDGANWGVAINNNGVVAGPTETSASSMMYTAAIWIPAGVTVPGT